MTEEHCCCENQMHQDRRLYHFLICFFFQRQLILIYGRSSLHNKMWNVPKQLYIWHTRKISLVHLGYYFINSQINVHVYLTIYIFKSLYEKQQNCILLQKRNPKTYCEGTFFVNVFLFGRWPYFGHWLFFWTMAIFWPIADFCLFSSSW